ncbi:unnamed protein product [marine sediment metagenome]|uniref:Uncharacterized protein n=1 Tax=marine sediment metagenome TaxID=412755 RepID=X1VUT9_9ZZZZ
MRKSSYWYNKANFFSLLIFFYNNLETISEKESTELKSRLNAFAEELPEDYALAAKEAVNNKRERLIRNRRIEELLLN